MRFVLLTSKPDSQYADTPSSYEYPARYHRFFEPLAAGEPMIAILYEPRSGGRGRMSYVGWAALRGTPVRSSRVTDKGHPLFVVHYVDRAQEFPNPVPRDILGEPVERWLRDMDPPNRNVLSSGASVRFLAAEEGQRILELGHAGQLGSVGEYAQLASDPESLVAERSRVVVEAVVRDARFRRQVMSAYEFRCAVTGLEIGTLPEGRATRLLDAAHIRPVGDRGPDAVTNGISLTPTVHRLFDEGLITARWREERLELVRSPRLEPSMVEAPDRGTTIRVEEGMRLILPTDKGAWPSRDQIAYHQSTVFKGPPSSLTA